MNAKSPWIILLVAGLAVAAYAGLRSSSGPVPEPAGRASADLPAGHPPIASGAATDGLPPGHPPMGAAPPGMPSARADGPGLTWTVPPRWKVAPNPSTMRLATYRIPLTPPDSEDAEMSVSRAGGSVTANANRWVGQFDEAGQKSSKKIEKTYAGFKTTVVEATGNFSGAMMGGPGSPKANYGLIGAIVEVPGESYFFKLTGPAATVQSARAEIETMLASLKKK